METETASSSVRFGDKTMPEIREEFSKSGVVFLRRALTEQETAAVERGNQELRVLHAERGAEIRRGRFIDEWPNALNDIQRWPTLVRLAEAFIGPDIALYYRRLLIKDSLFTGSISVHQELPFFNGGVNKFHIFVPVSENTEQNGHLRYYSGSHKYGLVGQGDIKPEKFAGVQDVGLDLYPGDLVLMHHFTWHHSHRVTSTEPRYLLQLMYQPADDGSYAGDSPELIAGEWKTDLRFPASDAVLYYNIWSTANRRK